MSKYIIEKRIAESAYCYTNVIMEVDSVEDYKKSYKEFLTAYQEMAHWTNGVNKIGEAVKPINK